MKNNNYAEKKLYSTDEIKELVKVLVNDETLTVYTAEDVQKIFGLGSIDTAYRLMRSPAFPSMRIGKALRVTKGNLIKFIDANSTKDIII